MIRGVKVPGCLDKENGRRKKELRNFGVLKKKERIRKEFLESTERRRASP